MKLGFRPVTIQSRLLAIFVVAAALPLAVVSLISYHNSVESVEKMVGNRTSRLAVSVGDDLSEKLRRRLGDRILLVNEPVQHYLEALNTAEPPEKVAARMDLLNYMGSLFQEYGRYYREIILADAEGVPLLRAPSRGAEEVATVFSASSAPMPPGTPTVIDTLTMLPEEIPLPGQLEKLEKAAEEIGRRMETQIRQHRIEIQTDENGTKVRAKLDAQAYKELADRIKEEMTRPSGGPRDPDFMGPDIPTDPRIVPLIESYRKRFTEDERLAARTGAHLAPEQNFIVLHRGAGGKAEAVRLVRPVFSVSQPDRRLGVMLLDMRVDYLFPEDLSGERFGSKGDVAVVNRKDGEILFHSRPEMIGQNLRIDSPELSEKVEKASPNAKGSGWFSFKDQGSRRLGAVYAVESAPWVVLTTASPREFETEAREAGLLNLAVASAAVLLALGFLLVSSRKISHSVHIVTEGAREIAAGNLNHTIRVKTRDEIQTLAETFNGMTRSLRENIALRENAAGELEALNRTLEDRVAVRTRELQALNEALGRANQELQELDRLKSNFLATVSHEFKTPLTSITAFSEILSDEMEERAAPPEVLRFLNIINNESGRLGRLIRNLLDLSRIEARRMRWEHSTFRVKDVVEASMDGLLPVFSEKNIQVHRSIACPDARISADRDRIQQVITNLIENAVKFSNKGSRIWVDCHESNHGQNGRRYLEFSVKDEGPGIPPSHLVRIFERFTQVDSTDTRGTGGSGLGLAISKEIVEHHGGSIWVDSEEGIGATFHFTIPRLGEDAQ
ncbi:MAG TPA: ATP-binding protein [Dongiaceae bacterium]|nr:ATP-binding protein [Dongiaceae bacterium]